MKYIEAFREGDKINEVYLCKYKQAATAKNGKAYENVILQDKTGTIDSKIWDPNSSGIGDFHRRCHEFSGNAAAEYQASAQGGRVRVCRTGLPSGQ